MDGEKNDLIPEERGKEEEVKRAGEKALAERPQEAASGKQPEKAPAEKEGFDFGRLLFGLLAVSFGLFLLGKNLGYVPSDIYIDVFRFWPTLVVVAGLSLLDTRRPFSFVLALLAFAAVAAFVGTVVKDAVLRGDNDDERTIPIWMDRDWEWEMRGPISGPVEGI